MEFLEADRSRGLAPTLQPHPCLLDLSALLGKKKVTSIFQVTLVTICNVSNITGTEKLNSKATVSLLSLLPVLSICCGLNLFNNSHAEALSIWRQHPARHS